VASVASQGGLRSLRECIDTLQKALEQKQRATQVLRLRSSFSQVHELHLEERQGLNRCISLRRQLAAVDPSTDVVDTCTTQLAPSHALDFLQTDSTSSQALRTGDVAGTRWLELEALTSEVAAEAASLQAMVEDSLGLSGALRQETEEAEARAASREAEELVELEHSVEIARAELARLREGRAGKGSSAVDETALKATIGRLQDEASALQDTKAALEADISELRRTLRAAKAAPVER